MVIWHFISKSVLFTFWYSIFSSTHQIKKIGKYIKDQTLILIIIYIRKLANHTINIWTSMHPTTLHYNLMFSGISKMFKIFWLIWIEIKEQIIIIIKMGKLPNSKWKMCFRSSQKRNQIMIMNVSSSLFYRLSQVTNRFHNMVMNHDSLKSNPMFDHRHFNEHQNHISTDRRHRRGSYSEASSAYSGSDTMQVSYCIFYRSLYLHNLISFCQNFEYQRNSYGKDNYLLSFIMLPYYHVMLPLESSLTW